MSATFTGVTANMGPAAQAFESVPPPDLVDAAVAQCRERR